MATRARIGIELSDESVLSVYHHWDGYPEWLGRILNTHYNSKELATELIDGGDMSSCWTVGEDDNIVDADKYGPNYYSSRGEDCPPRLDDNLFDYLLQDNEEFAYLYTRYGKWVCYNLHQYEENTMPEVVEIPSGALVC